MTTHTQVLSGAPIRARDLNATADAARAATIYPGIGDTSITGPFGVSTSGARRRPTPPPLLGFFPRRVPQPWDVGIYNDEGTWKATFCRCFVKRSGLCALLSDQTFSLPTGLATGSYYIGVRVELSNNAVTLLSGANLSDVAHTTLPTGSDQDYGRIPLFILSYVSGDSPTWGVVQDIRSMPDLGVYL